MMVSSGLIFGGENQNTGYGIRSRELTFYWCIKTIKKE